MFMDASLSPCKGKSFKTPGKNHKAFALTGRLADCYYTQGDALGWELLPFQGVLLLPFWAFSPYLNYIRKFSQFF